MMHVHMCEGVCIKPENNPHCYSSRAIHDLLLINESLSDWDSLNWIRWLANPTIGTHLCSLTCAGIPNACWERPTHHHTAEVSRRHSEATLSTAGSTMMRQVHGREVGEKEKLKSLNTMKGRGTGDMGVERNNLMRVAYAVT